MSYNKEYFFISEDLPQYPVAEGIERKIVARGGDMMIVEVHFKEGAIGTLHQHFHEQVTYCTRGSMMFEVEGEKQLIKAGDSVFMPKDCMHGAVCLEDDTILLDIFTPQRDDFIVLEKEILAKK